MDNSPYIGFVVPFLFCSRVKLNQLSPLVSLTRLPLASTRNNLPLLAGFFFGLIGVSPLSLVDPQRQETFLNDTHSFMIISSQPKGA